MHYQKFQMYPTTTTAVFENGHATQQHLHHEGSTIKQLDLSFNTKQTDDSTSILSAFSTSPDDSDLQFSCEDLNTAFSQTNIHTPEEPHFHDIEDCDTVPTSVAGTTLLEMLRHFPDLPSFVNCENFSVFATIWFDFRKVTALARHPMNRPQVQNWLESTALQIHFLMVTIVKSNPHSNDPESQPRRMFSAFRRLKDQIEITHQVFRIIENGRVYFNQNPSQAIAPLIESAVKIKKDVDYFLNSPTPVIPIMDEQNAVILKNADQVTMKELSNRVMDTYNLMPYNSSITASMMTSSNATTTANSPQSYHHQACSQLANNFMSTKNEPTDITTSTNEPMQPLFSHIQPSWIHFANTTSSLPVTPSIEKVDITRHNTQYYHHLSLPTSPTTCTQEPIPVDKTCAPCNSVCDLSLSPYQANNSPLNTLSHDGESDYEMDPMDIDVQEDKNSQQQQQQTDDEEEEDDDDEYVASDSLEDEDWKEEPTFTRRRTTRRNVNTTVATATAAAVVTARRSNRGGGGGGKCNNNVVTSTKELRKAANSIERHYTRRTATSYDAHTTHYLKSIFFDIYSSRDKLTKEQRRQVQKETGLKPRNITYWFSNHKRRFQNSLLVFKKTVKESNGAVKTYDDFLEWRRVRGLSEEILETEIVEGMDDTDNIKCHGGDISTIKLEPK